MPWNSDQPWTKDTVQYKRNNKNSDHSEFLLFSNVGLGELGLLFLKVKFRFCSEVRKSILFLLTYYMFLFLLLMTRFLLSFSLFLCSLLLFSHSVFLLPFLHISIMDIAVKSIVPCHAKTKSKLCIE